MDILPPIGIPTPDEIIQLMRTVDLGKTRKHLESKYKEATRSSQAVSQRTYLKNIVDFLFDVQRDQVKSERVIVKLPVTGYGKG